MVLREESDDMKILRNACSAHTSKIDGPDPWNLGIRVRWKKGQREIRKH